MVFKDMQKQVDEWVSHNGGYWDPHAILSRVQEELGEVAREIHDIHGPKKRKDTEEKGDLGVEICDTFFALICLANREGIDLDAAWERMMQKVSTRDKDRFKKK